MSLTALFGTIYESHYNILVNFYLYLQYFQQKIFNFNKISKSQTHPKCVFGFKLKGQLILLLRLFLLLFISFTTFFGIIHELQYIISANFYLYL